MELTILMPCLNEARTLRCCIEKAYSFLDRAGIDGEVVIADNGSTDGSQSIARNLGARVIQVRERGYGAALIAGINSSRGRYVIMGDSDDSYNFGELDAYVEALRLGYELVMGNRFHGGIEPGAMPFLHRYLGNPVLSFVGRKLFNARVGDFHCGLRGFDREKIKSLNLTCTGMEFASEMVVKASLHNFRVAEVPTTLHKDGRGRPPHLRTWRDGWRHLKFLLLLSPRWLFLYPGLCLFLFGVLAQTVLLANPFQIGGLIFDIHTLLFSAVASIIGLQLALFAALAKVFTSDLGLTPFNGYAQAMERWFSIEVGAIFGVFCLGAGVVLSIASVAAWDAAGFSEFDPQKGMRLVIPSISFLVAGAQLLFASFFYGVLKLGHVESSALKSQNKEFDCREEAAL